MVARAATTMSLDFDEFILNVSKAAIRADQVHVFEWCWERLLNRFEVSIRSMIVCFILDFGKMDCLRCALRMESRETGEGSSVTDILISLNPVNTLVEFCLVDAIPLLWDMLPDTLIRQTQALRVDTSRMDHYRRCLRHERDEGRQLNLLMDLAGRYQ
jgi:hypothetical protein